MGRKIREEKQVLVEYFVKHGSSLSLQSWTDNRKQEDFLCRQLFSHGTAPLNSQPSLLSLLDAKEKEMFN